VIQQTTEFSDVGPICSGNQGAAFGSPLVFTGKQPMPPRA
jgi:hypothetical protein